MSAPELTLLYDGSCPICCWEQRKLATKDHDDRLAFVDIQAPGFNAAEYGATLDDLMGRLHGMADDGRVLVGVDTLLATYRLTGWWWLYLPLSALPRRISDYCYNAFARRRQRISRRIGHWFGPSCDNNNCHRES